MRNKLTICCFIVPELKATLLKPTIVCVHIRGSNMNGINVTKCIGVMKDNKLSWIDHITLKYQSVCIGIINKMEGFKKIHLP